MPGPQRDHDVVVFGATGFVGRLTADYLARHAPAGTRVALAGRSAERLAEVRRALPAAAADWPLLTADAGDPQSLQDLATATSVVATTVGPYQRYGLPLVEACAVAGTHYADLAGEVLFVRDSIDAFHATAVASGARIVHSCGFDSVPSDLGVLLAHAAAAEAGDGELTDTTLVVRAVRGGFSGGTIDSLRTQVDAVRADRALAELVADPYSLSPDRGGEPDLGPEGEQLGIGRDADLGIWTAPFVMGPYNSRVVRRSNALLGHRYGPQFRYREVMSAGGSLAAPALAAAMAAGTFAAAAGMAFRPARLLLDRLLPSPGQGPSERVQRTGHFTVETHARTAGGARWVTTTASQGDPGYTATAVMLGESALALAHDGLPGGGGVLTPATGIGTALADRLRAAGFTITVARA